MMQAYTIRYTGATLYFTPITSIFLCHPSLTYLRKRSLISHCCDAALPVNS